MLDQLQKLVSLKIRCHISWAVAAVAVFGVTQLGASAVCNVRPVKYGAFDKRLWHVTLTLWLTYRTISFKRHLLHTNISLIHFNIQTLWSFGDLKYCVCILYLQIYLWIWLMNTLWTSKNWHLGKQKEKVLHWGF